LQAQKAQSALAPELSWTIDLARLHAEDGNLDKARHDLGLVYGHFTDGFETADLTSA
jgi:hypothetical protein